MDFIKEYLKDIVEIAKSLEVEKIRDIIADLVKVKDEEGRLFILGIGGSAGNSSHAVNDFRKLAEIDSYAPTDNISEFSARTNDEGFESTFIGYLKVSKLNSRDCILILSVGGGNLDRNVSVNLCKALDYANIVGANSIAIVGKTDGYAQKFAKKCLVIPEINPKMVTPYSESFQAIIWHLIVSHPMLKPNKTKW